MALAIPTTPLQAPNYFKLRKNRQLHRVHDSCFDGNCFNPGMGAPTRFAPLNDDIGNCVPTLYAGSSKRVVIYETVFHDVPSKTAFKTVPEYRLKKKAHSKLRLKRSLDMVQLRSADLLMWNLRRSDLIDSEPTYYGQTSKWAEAIHHQFPKAHGLLWTSTQCDPDTSYVFFGDRVNDGDFEIIDSVCGGSDPKFISDVRKVGRRSNIVVTV